ncbi:DUF3313 family protein [uncultured Tolumonas sp.]|uniref:DUF3313 family protein n=1 Tax=uncultured Tolumonas sp. TaxID=263765 RepID=UPI002A0A7F51|nr:DUF3313 family protein [uncultured Tolumonas sp.]
MKYYFSIFLLSMIGVLTGCSCVHPASQPGKNALNPQQESTLIYQQPATRLHWSAVIVESVRWHVTSLCYRLSAERQALLRFHLENALARELKGNDPHGPVLRVQAEITEVKPVAPLLNVASSALILLPVQSGGSAIQIRVIDAAGKTLYLDASLADNAGLSDFHGHFTTWAHSNTALDRIAERTRNLLEQTDGPH